MACPIPYRAAIINARIDLKYKKIQKRTNALIFVLPGYGTYYLIFPMA